MTVEVRPAVPADYPAVARLTVAAYQADEQITGTEGYGAVLADVATRAAAGDLLVAVEPVSGAVLGAVLYVLPGSAYAEVSGPGEAEFRMLAVDPAAQGRGVAGALVQYCLDRAAASGCAAVVISVRDFADAANRLYERFGFERDPTLDWSPMPDVQLLGRRRTLDGVSPRPG